MKKYVRGSSTTGCKLMGSSYYIKDGLVKDLEELDAISNEQKRFDRFIELNVFEQVLDLAKTSIIQAAWERGQEVHLHGWVYDIKDGLVKDLEVTIKNNEKLTEVYQLDI